MWFKLYVPEQRELKQKKLSFEKTPPSEPAEPPANVPFLPISITNTNNGAVSFITTHHVLKFSLHVNDESLFFNLYS